MSTWSTKRLKRVRDPKTHWPNHRKSHQSLDHASWLASMSTHFKLCKRKSILFREWRLRRTFFDTLVWTVLNSARFKFLKFALLKHMHTNSGNRHRRNADQRQPGFHVRRADRLDVTAIAIIWLICRSQGYSTPDISVLWSRNARARSNLLSIDQASFGARGFHEELRDKHDLRGKGACFWLIESANRLLFEVIRGLRLKLVLRTSKLSGQSVDETRLCFLPFQLLFSRSYTTAWSYESAAKHARRLHPTSTLVLATVEGRPDAVTNHRARISFRWL